MKKHFSLVNKLICYKDHLILTIACLFAFTQNVFSQNQNAADSGAYFNSSAAIGVRANGISPKTTTRFSFQVLTHFLLNDFFYGGPCLSF